jgi:predicted TIM-barrel fold metal-dependent hydrolase
MIIDVHTHVGNCLLGGEISEPYAKPPRLLSNLFEASGFRLMGGRKLFPRFSRHVEIKHNQERTNLGTPENLLRYMDHFGISLSVLQPIEPYRMTQDNLALCGPRLATFASVHPEQPGWEKRLRTYMEAGCLGLKIHPIIQNLVPGSSSVYQLLEEYAPYGKPVLLHAGESAYRQGEVSLSRLGRIADWASTLASFPRIRFIIAHMAMEGWKEALDLGERLFHLYVDTSFKPASHVREALRRLGRERVLFASDWPFSLQKAPLRVMEAVTSSDRGLRRALLSENARSLLCIDMGA